MLFIVFHLDLAAALRLIDRHLHGLCDRIRVHDNMSLRISRRAADSLDQRCLRAQEAFFIRIQDRHKCDLRDVQTFPQKIDAHQHIENIQPHIPDDLCALKRIHIGVEIFHPDAHLAHIIGQVLCHAFGQRGHKDLILFRHLFVDLADQVVDLPFHRAHGNFRIEQPCRADHLLCAQQLMIFLIWTGRSGYKQDLIYLTLKFFKIQGAVVLRRRESETVIHQRSLPGLVPMVHPSDLRDRLVGLIDHHDKIIREVIDQRVRRLPRRKPCQMPGIVLDPGTESRLFEHFYIKVRPLRDALRFQELVLTLEFLHALVQFFLDIMHRTLDILFIHHIVGRREDCHML